MKVTIGVTTYNRKDLLEIMAKSLYGSNLSMPHNIRIYDDCSTDYDKTYLVNLFPTAATVKVNTDNLKSDLNIYKMYVDFLTTEDDYFFNADSDLIFNKKWLAKAIDAIKETEGVLSLFNSNAHESYKTVNDKFCLKKNIGSAGTLFTRSRVEELIGHFDSVDKVSGFDWQWSNYFNAKGVSIYCMNNSLVQHIGYNGQNSHLYFDVGKNYIVESIEDGQILNDILEKSIKNIRIKEKKRIEDAEILNKRIANDFMFHFKRCIIILLKLILPSKIIVWIKLKILKN